MKKLDIVGNRYNRLKVLSQAPVRNQKTYWNCTCDCGNHVTVWGSALTTGQTQSCGCLQKEMASKANKVHGVSNKTSEYRTWVNMKTRCYNENVADPDYFGKGIKVCDRWMDEKFGFVNFISDMGKKPSPLHSIERLESDKDYEPNNCKWGTEEEQVRNKRNNVWIEYGGKRMILTDWARCFGVDQANLAASLRVKSIEVVYDFYLKKHGSLPAPKEYVVPCKANSPMNIRKRQRIVEQAKLK